MTTTDDVLIRLTCGECHELVFQADDSLVKVHCGKCGRVQSESNYSAGSISRHKCHRCGTWTVLVVVPDSLRDAT